MIRKTLTPLSLLCLLLALTAHPAAARGAAPLAWADDPAELKGWEQVGEGLWKRRLEDGTMETEAFGQAGLAKVLDQLNAELVNLVDAYLLNPTTEMAEVLDTHLALIKRVEEGVLAGKEGPQISPRVGPTCTTSYSASAGGLSGCGNFAQASSSYSGTSASACFGLCDLYSYAYVTRTVCDDTVYTASQTCNKPGVINQSCSSYASLSHNPVKTCYAYGYASIYCPSISWFRSASQTSTSCGLGVCQTCCTVTASCTNAGGGSRSCTGTCENSWAINDCYAACDDVYYWCPNPKPLCPI